MNSAQATGRCQCGCGQPTRIARVTDSRWGHVAGQPVRWINGHQRRLILDAWVEEDRGYQTPCWIWQRAYHGDSGYGAATLNGKTYNAHRAVYEQRIGPLDSTITLDHLCRVRACVNPDHMDPVSNAINVQRGDRAKLTPAIVREIRHRTANGDSLRTLAMAYGVSKVAISDVRRGRTWTNVA